MSESFPKNNVTLPKIWTSRRGDHVPTTDEAISYIKDRLIRFDGLKAGDARKKARKIVFDFLDGKTDGTDFRGFYF